MRRYVRFTQLQAALVCACAIAIPVRLAAQELVPRAYWPAPAGTNLVSVGYQYSSGDVLTDPTLPISGVDSENHAGSLAYRHTLNLLGRTANLQLSLPYIDGSTSGVVEGEFRRRDLSAAGDMQAQLSVNLMGAPSMDRAAFQALRANPRTIVGASLLLQPPTGAYNADRVINAGSNRWAARAGLGAIWPLRQTWLLEAEISTWFMGDNDDYLGKTRKQDPITELELHLVKRIRPGFWASLDANYYYGGKSTVGGADRKDLQRNSRFGGTIVFPFRKHHAIRLAYSAGVVTETGGDYDNFSLVYAYVW